eukprot:TRINITY_DN2164_c0_g1_i1.p1 TRINITY_DN2164_c0_g1~~TRINITY_DN2164_c0_g1_i1.p1  ORF type:complete len:443 (+),score=134.06 TRINITY_DN2164_c0_g1_i1:161-1489(+)
MEDFHDRKALQDTDPNATRCFSTSKGNPFTPRSTVKRRSPLEREEILMTPVSGSATEEVVRHRYSHLDESGRKSTLKTAHSAVKEKDETKQFGKCGKFPLPEEIARKKDLKHWDPELKSDRVDEIARPESVPFLHTPLTSKELGKKKGVSVREDKEGMAPSTPFRTPVRPRKLLQSPNSAFQTPPCRVLKSCSAKKRVSERASIHSRPLRVPVKEKSSMAKSVKTPRRQHKESVFQAPTASESTGSAQSDCDMSTTYSVERNSLIMGPATAELNEKEKNDIPATEHCSKTSDDEIDVTAATTHVVEEPLESALVVRHPKLIERCVDGEEKKEEEAVPSWRSIGLGIAASAECTEVMLVHVAILNEEEEILRQDVVDSERLGETTYQHVQDIQKELDFLTILPGPRLLGSRSAEECCLIEMDAMRAAHNADPLAKVLKEGTHK